MGMNPDAQHDLMEWCGGDGRGLETQRVREIWGGGGQLASCEILIGRPNRFGHFFKVDPQGFLQS